MAKGQVKKVLAQIQAENIVFALDIGTRSIIGMVGRVEEDKVNILAIEKEEHTERAMVDGQIENIEKVSMLAEKIKKRLEDKLGMGLSRVCVAAAGRALRTKRADFEMELPTTQLIDDEVISRLEAGAISKAEEAFDAENDAKADNRRFYLVGYTVCQYFLDQYMISSLKDHRGQQIKVDLIATFLPSEVVESLYTTMNKIGLEVASITLEPIAAINAAIPANLRLLNLVMVDIGAGTSDIAACTGGSVTGYTMATVAGDEITETIMKEYLVDFPSAEMIKAQLDQEEEITFTDILGLEHKITREQILQCIQATSSQLCKEIANKILEINGGPPSALFLAGGGSKLTGLKEELMTALQMDANRVAIAGNYFRANAYSEDCDLNNPEYATPLGIVISSGLNLINDSFRVILNNRQAKLFRSGSFTVLNLLMMNGYGYRDILGRPGVNLTVTVNGKRKVFYGTSAQPASLFINKKEGKLSEIIHAGDCIDFVPAVQGIPARACLGDIEGAAESLDITLNGVHTSLKTPLKSGDIIVVKMPKKPELPKEDISLGDKGASALEDVSKEGNASALKAEAPLEGSPAAKEGPIAEAPPALKEEPAAKAPPAVKDRPVTAENQETNKMPMARSESEAGQPPAAGQEPTTQQEPIVQTALPIQAAPQEEAVFQPVEPRILFYLNDSQLRLPHKEDGSPYYLMDMIQYSGIDLKHPKGRVQLTVNGLPAAFQQTLRAGDIISIIEEER